MALYDPAQSHDLNFKTLLVENIWDAITFALPKCADYFRHEPELEPIREETIKTFFSDSFARMDVPVLAKYEKVAFTFLLEHMHDPHSFSIHHIARYVSHLEEQYERDVIPIVYFPNASSKNKTLKREVKSSFMGKRYHFFTYEAVLLRDKQAKKYLTSPNLIARLLLPFMNFAERDWLEVLDGSIQGVFQLVDPTKRLRQTKYLDFIFNYFNLGQEKWDLYRAHKHKQKEGEVIEMIETISNVWKKESFTEGFVKGKTEGEFFGKLSEGQDMLLMLFPRKLGHMPEDVERGIRALTDVNRVHEILAHFLEIESWNEVRRLLA